jgi:hypothetical protein
MQYLHPAGASCVDVMRRDPRLLERGRADESDVTNILLIHSDQRRADCLGVSGHPQLRTSCPDRLAADGCAVRARVHADRELRSGTVLAADGALVVHWKYVWNLTAEDGLYDLAHDPAELRNLARDPSARPELDRLRRRLLEWLRGIGDPLASGAGAVQLDEGRTY